jgi:glycosyltransferase involved in cell wall biosynthesis
MNPRIVHVASGREWRGGQNQVRLLARALRGDPEFEQVVVTGRGSVLAKRLEESGVPVRLPSWKMALDPRTLAALLDEARGPRTILHAHDAHALVLAGIAARFTGARLVVTRRVDFQLRRPGFWRRADRVIAISSAIREVLIADGIPEDRIAVVHSGIDPEEVRSTPPGGMRALYHLAPNVPLAVNVAALVPHKDQATLVAAAVETSRELPDLHWVIVGDGPLLPDLMQQVQHAGLEQRVHFAGHVSNAWGIIGEADVFVMSSREEGLGTSILDAMALGVPVAATRAGGIPEMVGAGAGLLVPVGDGVQLGRAVSSLIGDKELRLRIREKASQQLARFTAEAMADGVRSVYRSILPTG